MPPKRRGRPSPAQKSSAAANIAKEGISVGLVTDDEEEENALGGATLEFVPLGMSEDAIVQNGVTEEGNNFSF